jgi:acyl-CoA thioesterase I
MKALNARRGFSLIAAGYLALFSVMTFANSTRADGTARPIRLIAFGDSLTAGYMLKPSESFASQLEMALRAKGHKVRVINAGVSGDTTAAGLERLDWTLSEGADAVLLELGANDALRGIDPKVTRANLDKMLTAIKAKGADVLIAGMKAPGNWGDDYVETFDAIYPEMAEKYAAPLYPFFLEGVALDPKLVLSDGLHPTAAGVAEIVKRILPLAETLVARAATRLAAAKT